MPPRGDIEEISPGLARERTDLAWTRTALSFAAVGGAMLKTSIAAGVTVLALSVLVWAVRRLFPGTAAAPAAARRLLLVALTVVAVALVALAVAISAP